MLHSKLILTTLQPSASEVPAASSPDIATSLTSAHPTVEPVAVVVSEELQSQEEEGALDLDIEQREDAELELADMYEANFSAGELLKGTQCKPIQSCTSLTLVTAFLLCL